MANRSTRSAVGVRAVMGALLVLSLAGCSKHDSPADRIIGTWAEDYDALMDRTLAQLPPATDELFRAIRSLLSTMALDPELFRAGLEYVGTITPVQQILARPEIRQRIDAVRAAVSNAPPPSLPGPKRQQLLAIVG